MTIKLGQASIIVDADGFLWYPCRVLEEKTINLIDSDLLTYVESRDAEERRARMAACDLQCAWYQYYATQSFVNPREVLSAWAPYYRDLINGGKQPMAVVPAMPSLSPVERAHGGADDGGGRYRHGAEEGQAGAGESRNSSHVERPSSTWVRLRHHARADSNR